MPAALVRLAALAPLAALGAWLLNRVLDRRDEGHHLPPIRTGIDIAAPIDDVWAVLSDVERQPTWMHDLKAVRLTTPGPVGVGTRGVGRVRVFGIGAEDPVEIVAFEPPVHFGIRHLGFVAGEGDIRLEAVGPSRTRVEWVERLVPQRLPALGATVIAAIFGPIFRADLERLAALVEAEAA